MMCKNYRYLKRLMDIVIAIFAIIMLALPMLFIGAVVYLEDGDNALFCQKRVGKDGKLFVMYKFRTMYSNAPANLSCLEMERRQCYVTRAGHILRRFSLDELPQLFNILKGDMSLIGPRPLIPEETEVHQARLERGVYQVRPGLTGIAQVRGRNIISDYQKVEYDYQYISGISLKMDIDIFFETFPLLFSGKGIMNHTCNQKQLTRQNVELVRKAI